ncbi:MAG: HNH endonuclease signature motif containing protein [Acidobacteriota bacterium]
MNPRYEIVAERAGHRCEYCHAPERVFNFPFEVEHILPRNRAGKGDLENLALACRACNLFKSSYTFRFDMETQTEVRLFDPRRDEWAVNFQIDIGTGEIAGLTPIGRVTVQQLQMNNPAQLAARLRWIDWDIFP